MARRTFHSPDPPNPIDIVEAAYDLERDDRTWLLELATLIRPLIDAGRGVVAYRFDVRVPFEQWIDNAVVLDIDPARFQACQRFMSELSHIAQAMHLRADVLMTMRAELAHVGVTDEDWPKIQGFFDDLGGGLDTAALQTVEPTGHGVVFWSVQPEPRVYDARTKRLWRRVGAHIAAGRRLRAAMASGANVVEAVVSPSGRIEHAEGEAKAANARESLRDAVLRQERARGRGRREDPEGATAAWTALVSGRWSLVDRFERDGKRYLVARRNELVLPDPRALTSREHAIVQLVALGKSNKLIAYELGLAESTVGTHVSSAMRKLGVRTRVELVELVVGFASELATETAAP